MNNYSETRISETFSSFVTIFRTFNFGTIRIKGSDHKKRYFQQKLMNGH